jgi:DNA-binding NarL/FixJ family response regulator
MAAKLRLLLAEDHVLVREGLRRLLNEQEDFEIVGEATDGPEAVQLCTQVAPDIALIDLSMPTMDGIKVMELVHAQCPDVRLIALTRHDDQSFVGRAMSAGAVGYVLKQSASTELISAIRMVAAGTRYVAPSIRMGSPPPSGTRCAIPAAAAPLTAVEEQVLRLVGSGCSNAEIAQRLSLPADDVWSVRRSAMDKLGLVSRADVARYANREGWL